MSLEALGKFAESSGNEEIVSAFNAVKESYTKLEGTNKQLGESISYHETEAKKAFKKRDSIASMVMSKFGIEEITEDALNGVLKNGSDIDNLTGMLDKSKKEKEELEKMYSGLKTSYKIEKELTKLGAITDTNGSKAYSIILDEISKGLSFDDKGNAIFTDGNGATIRNSDGTPMTLSDRYNEFKGSEEFSFLFKEKKGKSGSGASNNGTYVKEAEYFDKNSPNFSLSKQGEIYRTNPALYKQLKG